MGMTELTSVEARVLGVLIEKSFATPDQYPLTLHALVAGCNQRSNRDPATDWPEGEVFAAVESLRFKRLAVRVDQHGARVAKYRHEAREALGVGGVNLAALAELLLRGPQTLGEVRGRASRLQPIETLEAAQNVLQTLIDRDPPLVRRLPPSPGSRSERYAQTLAPEADGETKADEAADEDSPGQAAAVSSDADDLPARVAALEDEVRSLRSDLRRLSAALGEPDAGASEPH